MSVPTPQDYVGQRGSQQLGESDDEEPDRVVAFVDIHTYSEVVRYTFTTADGMAHVWMCCRM